jgi:hypothetical protein
MIDALQGIIEGLQRLVSLAAYLVAGFITLSVFARKKAFGPTLGTGIIAFIVAWAVQPANLQHLGDLFDDDLLPWVPAPPFEWVLHAVPAAAHGLASVAGAVSAAVLGR